jgi:hypothetical protein
VTMCQTHRQMRQSILHERALDGTLIIEQHDTVGEYPSGKDVFMQIEQLQTEIEMLSEEEFAALRRWFAEKDWERWDRQIESDSVSGKLNFLIDEARTAKQQQTLQEL